MVLNTNVTNKQTNIYDLVRYFRLNFQKKFVTVVCNDFLKILLDI